ncbi:hypothetical protein [Lyngbya aestuarii]|uniref:hypothetical protein n=1 Tax=Lyngbya aestuarii TaxID=118322 RepID=UPI00403E0D12
MMFYPQRLLDDKCRVHLALSGYTQKGANHIAALKIGNIKQNWQCPDGAIYFLNLPD